MTNGPLRVLVVQPFGVLGGAENWLLRLLDASTRLDVEVVLMGSGPLEDELTSRGIPVTLRLASARPAEVLFGYGRWLLRELKARQPDVLLANGVKAAAAAVPAARLAGIPVVWMKHDHAYDRALARPLARLADRVAAAVEELAAPMGRTDTVIIPVPLPEREPASREEAREFWAGRGVALGAEPTLVMPTRLVPQKGVDDAITALARPDAAGWRLVVVGREDPTAPGEHLRLQRLAVEHGVAERVCFAEPVDGVVHWLAAFDGLAVLSKEDARGFGKEGFGTSAFDAMVAGIPVIGVTGGAVVRRLEGRAGIGVGPGDPEGVAAALARLGDPATREAMGRAGRDLVAAHPDAGACAAGLESLLAETARRPGAALSGGPPLSVVATVLDEGVAVDRLLAAVVRQLQGDDEVVVVDGGSTDDTASRVEAWAVRDRRVRLVSASGSNIAAGRNAGIRAARQDTVATTDAGCEPAPGWLDALRVAFAERTPPDLVSGIYRVTGDSLWQRAMAVAQYPDPPEARRRGPLVRGYGKVFGLVYDPRLPGGRSMAFTREAWASAGGFPEQLDTAEDVRFGRLVTGMGGRAVLQPDAVVTWAQRSTVAGTARMYYRYGWGDGVSGDRKLVARNLIRAAAYPLGAAALLRGGRTTRTAAALGAAAYLSLPLARARRTDHPWAVAARVPFALAVKDLPKAAGCAAAMLSSMDRRDAT